MASVCQPQDWVPGTSLPSVLGIPGEGWARERRLWLVRARSEPVGRRDLELRPAFLPALDPPGLFQPGTQQSCCPSKEGPAASLTFGPSEEADSSGGSVSCADGGLCWAPFCAGGLSPWAPHDKETWSRGGSGRQSSYCWGTAFK